ncbi:hypothetical protein BX600DRAFT_450572 [Xylariales sp. PMI_506]|nr:hypothetical protein BX600DRAFT_450572 [Xylariales sp. PMI_506]
MGIKGIYKEIGPGKRVSLTKLAVDQLEQSGQPLRIAIDISIWQFQVQAAKGGSNPAIRTLFYRLLRLLSLSIQPIFVFDGPNKPVFKRNKRSGRGDGVATSMAKRLIRLFGFRVHDAPGEAEAECALLQQQGIVDAVLSEDVDTIMFGCTRTLRNWSAEGSRGSKSPTHISVYDTAEFRPNETGLDREGMVLVALMSGGDYLPEGIPGAGIKLACEAARGGFGKSLCRLKRSDASGLSQWRENLRHELRTNESGFFRTRHKALVVPEDFPNLDILRYYTHPVVSPESTLERLRGRCFNEPLDVLGLREFVRETFDWNYRGGAIKFIRVLAPCLLVRKVMDLSAVRGNQSSDLERMGEEEGSLVRSITGRREHFSTDATPELRISFTPTEIVGHSFEEEPEEEIAYGRDGLALNSDDELEPLGEEEVVVKPGSRKPFSPNEPDLCWIPETFTKLGIPLMVEDWEAAQRAKIAKKPKTRAPKSTPKLGGMATGALDKFVRVTKNIATVKQGVPASLADNATSIPRARTPLNPLPVSHQRPFHASALSSQASPNLRRPSQSSKQPKRSKKATTQPKAPVSDSSVNPWTIASLHSSPRVGNPKSTPTAATSAEVINISSSPPSSPSQVSLTPLMHESVESENSRDAGRSPKCPSRILSATEDEDSHEMSRTVRTFKPIPQADDYISSRKTARKTNSSSEGNGSANERVMKEFIRDAPPPILCGVVNEDEVSGSDTSADDLPPMSHLIGQARGTLSNEVKNITPVQIPSSPVPHVDDGRQTKATEPKIRNQTNLGDAFGMRITKAYVPRKSEPGFYKEIDVSCEEPETGSSGRGNGARRWRMSNISVIDLTGDSQ